MGRHSFLSIAQTLHRLAVSRLHPAQGATYFTCLHQNLRKISQELENLPVDSSSGGGGGGPSILDADKNALQVPFLISINPCVPPHLAEYITSMLPLLCYLYLFSESQRDGRQNEDNLRL